MVIPIEVLRLLVLLLLQPARKRPLVGVDGPRLLNVTTSRPILLLWPTRQLRLLLLLLLMLQQSILTEEPYLLVVGALHLLLGGLTDTGRHLDTAVVLAQS